MAPRKKPVETALDLAAASTALPVEDAPAIVHLERLGEKVLILGIEGVTPLIPHKWSEKAINQMAEKQQALVKTKTKHREPKNPEEEAEASTYRLPDGQAGMPATAFKAAAVGGCRFYDSITIVQAKQLLFVVGEGPEQLVRIEGPSTMREDTPRNSGGGVDLRYRMQFWPWTARLEIRYIPNMIDAESIASLVDAGGRGGVGDWRPSSPKSSTGTYGQFRVSAEGVM